MLRLITTALSHIFNSIHVQHGVEEEVMKADGEIRNFQTFDGYRY